MIKAENNLNIKELTFKVHQEEKGFDPRKEIAEEDWENIGRAIVDADPIMGGNGDAHRFYGMAAKRKLLLPEKAKTFGASIMYKSHIRSKITDLTDKGHKGSLADFLYSANFVNPFLKGGDLPDSYLEEEKGLIKELCAGQVGIHMGGGILHMLSRIKLKSPGKEMRIPYPNQFVSMIKNLIQEERENNYHISGTAADFKIIFPNRIKELNIENADWKKMKNDLSFQRDRGDWYEFLDLATDMAILSADEIRFDEVGARLIFSDREKQFEGKSTPKMPEVRRF
jgi:hypothetical protein